VTWRVELLFVVEQSLAMYDTYHEKIAAAACDQRIEAHLKSMDAKVDVLTAQTVISEVGVDMSPWKTEHHFDKFYPGLCAHFHKPVLVNSRAPRPGGLDGAD